MPKLRSRRYNYTVLMPSNEFMMTIDASDCPAEVLSERQAVRKRACEPSNPTSDNPGYSNTLPCNVHISSIRGCGDRASCILDCDNASEVDCIRPDPLA